MPLKKSTLDLIASIAELKVGRAFPTWLETDDADANAIAAALKSLQSGGNDSSSVYENIFHNSGDAIFVEGYDGTIHMANKAACEMHDMSAEELIGKNVFDLIPVEQREKAREEFELFVAGKKDRLETDSYINGKRLKVGISARRINYHQQPALLFFVRDISHHDDRQTNLEYSKRRYKAFYQHSEAMMCMHDAEGRIFNANPALLRSLGYSEKEMLEMSIADLLAGNVRSMFAAYLNEVTSKGHASGVMKVTSKDGEDRFWAYNNQLIYDFPNADPYVLGSAIDITERYIIEKELESTNKIAELNIKRLHKALTELEVAKEEVDKSARVKQDFLANMSHEIRTPMNTIIGFADLLKETTLNEEQQEYLKAIRSSGENLLVIINDILDFSKIEVGMLPLDAVPMDVTVLVAETCEVFQHKAKENGLELVVEQDDAIADKVLGDATRLKQILINLVNNALKFTSKGQVKVETKLTNSTDTHYDLQFVVSDTGIGIPEDELATVFESFSQAKNVDSRKYGGTGLGLSIVKSLVELHDGTIAVESKSGKGATFRVNIRYRREMNDSDKQVKPKETATYEALTDMAILLAEDNVLNQQLTTKILTSKGARVTLAENGKEVLDALKKGQFDVILMDIQMPEMDGPEATKVIREEMGLDIPIIALTAHTLEEEIEKYMELGMNGHLAKPFNKGELTTMIHSIVLPARGSNGSTKKKKKAKGSDIISVKGLVSLSDGDYVFVKEMVQLFMDNSPGNVALLQEHIAAGRYDDTAALAHKMLTSYNSIGSEEGVRVLREIESKANKSGAASDYTDNMADLNHILESSISALEDELVRIDELIEEMGAEES